MTTKYHINKNGQKTICHATKRACRYGEHFTENGTPTLGITTKEELFQKMDETSESQRVAAIRPNPFPEPEGYIYSTYDFDFDDDPYYAEAGNTVLSEDIVTMPSEDELLKDIYGARRGSGQEPFVITPELRQFARDAGVFNPSSYVVERGWGYYDEIETSVELKHEVLAKLRERYYQQEDAVDGNGILPWIRREGVATKGKTPVEALTHYLTTKNVTLPKGFTPTAAELNSISAGNLAENFTGTPVTPYVEVAGKRKPQMKEIIGIVKRKPGSNKYEVLDGASQVAWLRQNSANGRFNKAFIVIA